MKKKKIIMYVTIIILLLILLGIGFIIFNNIKLDKNKKENIEYIPEEEFGDNELRKTIISLYFLDKETGKLTTEAREIDSKQLIKDPYEVLINLLIQGPKNKNLLKLIPDNTKLNKAVIEKNILYIDFSEEFVKEQKLGKEQEELIIKSIVNTVTELTEVNKVCILINGKETGFPDGEIMFNKIFTRGK